MATAGSIFTRGTDAQLMADIPDRPSKFFTSSNQRSIVIKFLYCGSVVV
jgi:hypothetical protein